MTILNKIRQHGIFGSAKKAANLVKRKTQNRYHLWRVKEASVFSNPDKNQINEIEEELKKLNVNIEEYHPSVDSFKAFQASKYFPPDYHGGIDGPVWDEKLLEHWVSYELLDLSNYNQDDIYLDIAAGSSPWANKLREKYNISSYAIDLEIKPNYKDLPFYKAENATSTSFANDSVRGASLQCAYEMFLYRDDIDLWREMARILKPEGKVIVVPLYLHTHYCSYSTPEYFGKGCSDSIANEYVCTDWTGIPSARFYDTDQLKERVLNSITDSGMQYRIYVLRNQSELGNGIYCHFILEVTK